MTTDLKDRLAALRSETTNTAPDPVEASPARTLVPNRFGGKCGRCSVWIEPEGGNRRKIADRWVVFHNEECPDVPHPIAWAPQAPLAVGVYVTDDGSIVKVRENKAQTNLYTSRWTSISGERLTLAGEHVSGEWVYAPELKRTLRADQRMTIDQAKNFGIVFAQCAKCGRHLKDADSVEAGIGPVCARSFAL